MNYPVVYPAGADSDELRFALTEAGLPIDDLGEDNRFFARFAGDGGDTVGFGGMEPYGRDVLLRSIVVLPAFRGRGQGRAIVDRLTELAWQEFGSRRGFLFTTTAAPFFSQLGFRPVARNEAPESILATRQATTICATADLLRRDYAAND